MGSRRKDIGRQSALRGAVAGAVLALGLGGASVALADSALAWGDNVWGQLGNGSSTNSNVPVAVTGLSRGITGAAAGIHSLAIQNGAAKAWGRNWWGELGNGSNANSDVPVNVTGLSSGVTAVSAGSGHSLAIQNGAAKAWGHNSSGELGNGSNGSDKSSNVPVAVTGLSSGVTAIAAGVDHSLAIQNGAAQAWGMGGVLGNGSYTQSNIPVTVTGLSSGVTAIAAGYVHSFAIQDGAAKAWGYGYHGELGNGSSGRDAFSNVPVDVAGLSSGVTAVAAGDYHSLAIQNGNVYAWGWDSWGQLGNGGATGIRAEPVLVLDRPIDAVAVVASSGSSYALFGDGALWVWGFNNVGQLGLGDVRNRTSPTQLKAPAGYRFTGIDAGSFHAVATVTAVPEPGSLVLFALGCCVVVGSARGIARRPLRSSST